VGCGPCGSSVLLSSYGIGDGHSVNALSAYRGERFMQGVDDVIGTDNIAQAVAMTRPSTCVANRLALA
jgi:hypothetical protein